MPNIGRVQKRGSSTRGVGQPHPGASGVRQARMDMRPPVVLSPAHAWRDRCSGGGRAPVRAGRPRARPDRRPRHRDRAVRRARVDARVVVHRHRALRHVAAAGAADRAADDARRASCGSWARCRSPTRRSCTRSAWPWAGCGPARSCTSDRVPERPRGPTGSSGRWSGWATRSRCCSPCRMLFSATPSSNCPNCPENLLLVWENETAFDLVVLVLGLAGIAMLAGAVLRARAALAPLGAGAAARAGARGVDRRGGRRRRRARRDPVRDRFRRRPWRS